MKKIVSILCSIALILSATLPTLAAHEGLTKMEEDTSELDESTNDDLETLSEHYEEMTSSQGWIRGMTPKAPNFASHSLSGKQNGSTTTHEIKKETNKPAQPLQSKFARIAKKQYLITLGLTACATGVNYFCSSGSCYESQLAQGIAGAAPVLISYVVLSTGIAYFTTN